MLVRFIWRTPNRDNQRNESPRCELHPDTKQYAVGKAVCAVLQPYEVIPNPGDDEKLGLTGWVMSTGKPFLATSANDLFGHPHWSGKFDQKQMPEQELRLATFLAVPLRDLHGKIIGVLKAERLDDSNTNQFSVSDQIVLEALARVAARCIVYAEDAQRESSDAAVIAWALNIIAEAVATEGDLDAFLDIVVRVIPAATEADSCAVFLIDESKKTLTQRAGWGSQELRKVIRSYKRPDRSQVIGCENDAKCNPPHCDGAPALEEAQRVGLTAWVAATGKSFHASNFGELRKHCHHLGRYDKPNYEGNQTCGAWLGVPLRVGGTIVGVLKIENVSEIGTPDDRDFDLQIERRLDVLAQDIALAIERLQSQSPARFRVIHQAMPTIREILQGERDVPKLVELVVKKTAELFSARACALFLKEGERLIQPEWAAVGWAERGPTVRDYDLVPLEEIVDSPVDDRQKVGLTVWIAGMKEKFVAKSNLELTSHPHHLGTYDGDNFEKEEKCETFMGVPLVSGMERELIGVLKVETKMSGAEFAYFNEQDELVFELIADSAAIAIQNARLLEARTLTDNIVNRCPNNTQVFLALR